MSWRKKNFVADYFMAKEEFPFCLCPGERRISFVFVSERKKNFMEDYFLAKEEFHSKLFPGERRISFEFISMSIDRIIVIDTF
jgi:hypothetical protein